MAGLPYTFKTTAMLEKYGKLFKRSDTIQNGDLIWIKGHVVIITDKDNNLVTEAAGYESSGGKVQTITIEKMFKDIYTLNDLLDAYYKKKLVTRLDRFGKDFKESPVKLFKLT